MRNALQTTCDACDEVLDGKVGTAFVKKRYLQIQGAITWKYWDRHGQFHWVNAVQGPSAFNATLFFCNGFCLDDFMGQRLMIKAKYHEENNLPKIDIESI